MLPPRVWLASTLKFPIAITTALLPYCPTASQSSAVFRRAPARLGQKGGAQGDRPPLRHACVVAQPRSAWTAGIHPGLIKSMTLPAVI